MSTELRMPALSPTMTEGTIVRWLVDVGDPVRPGDTLAEIETDKITVAFEAIDAGVLERILVPNGAVVQVNDPIAVLGAEQTTERRKMSPVARRAAREAGIDTDAVTGTGPHGRIVKADIERAALPAPAPAAPAAPPNHTSTSAGTRVPHDAMRRTIAQRLQQAKRDIPHFYASIGINLDAMLALRLAMNESASGAAGGSKLSINDFVLKAAAATLRALPALNASYADDAVIVHQSVDLSVAVAVPGGLVTPVIRAADRKDVPTIAAEMRDLTARARSGTLRLDDVHGGTFSVSNLGAHGVTSFAAIINPPQAAIVAVGAAEPRPIVKHGAIAVATVLDATLSVDHRVADGALAAAWLAHFKAILEAPFRLLV